MFLERVSHHNKERSWSGQPQPKYWTATFLTNVIKEKKRHLSLEKKEVQRREIPGQNNEYSPGYCSTQRTLSEATNIFGSKLVQNIYIQNVILTSQAIVLTSTADSLVSLKRRQNINMFPFSFLLEEYTNNFATKIKKTGRYI